MVPAPGIHRDRGDPADGCLLAGCGPSMAGPLLFGGIALALGIPAQIAGDTIADSASAVGEAAQQEETTRHKRRADDSSDRPLVVSPGPTRGSQAPVSSRTPLQPQHGSHSDRRLSNSSRAWMAIAVCGSSRKEECGIGTS